MYIKNLYSPPFSCSPTPDGNFLIAGSVNPGPFGSSDYWFFKIDSTDGEKLWEKVYSFGTGTSSDAAGKLHPLPDGSGDYIASGVTNNGPGDRNDGWALRVNSKGDLIWKEAYSYLGIGDGPGAREDFEAFATSTLLDNGNLMASGETNAYNNSLGGDPGKRAFLTEINATTGERVFDTFVAPGVSKYW